MNLLKQTLPLTLISSLRFLGLFIVMPTISVYAISLGASPLMVGLAVGGYALTQILFQTPFGILGDKFDKRYVIGIGLVIFILGSLICAWSESVYWLVAGRFIQGVGAIASVITAFISDLTPEESRTKAMAVMGGGISVSFLVAMLVGPLIGGYFGLKILFYIAGLCSLLALFLLIFKVPTPPKISHSFTAKEQYTHYLKDKNLWMMYLSSFLQKALINLGFVIIPLVLHTDFDFSTSDLWKFYAPAGVLGIFAMAPASIFAEKYGYYKRVMIAGIVAFALCFALFCYADYLRVLWIFVVGVLVFFIALDIHEPIMQSLASKYPSSSQRSSALGLFTSFGFLGSFMGALLGGVLYSHIGLFWLSLLTGLVCVAWILSLALILKNPKKLKTLYLYNTPLSANLENLEGIIDYHYTSEVLCVKYDPALIDEEEIKKAL
ncbi:MFS transporter [Helicobacter brantae]|uniref:MFS transporter n=1 Tax=Helicobacter brantae TaxID=375927 RepID=A0A3D8J1M0_9HELI|nr:MFS transporter [Helicobacter brantae]RDU70754.1 MFS transporter [Helicobacter brantae]